MEAKDTVMTVPQLWEAYQKRPGEYKVIAAIKAQAEISFKAGQEERDKQWKAEMRRQTEKRLKLRVYYNTKLSSEKQAGIGEVMKPSKELLEIGRKAIEDALIEWRDNRLSEFNRGNGLVIREKDGRDSNIIRFGAETALKIGLKAMGQAKLKEWRV